MRVVCINDIHLGHPQIGAPIMRTNFNKLLYPQLNDDIDILFVGGDFFDSQLSLNSVAGYETACIIDELKTLAAKHNFIIRVLRGTFSHDRHQNQFFLTNTTESVINGEALVKVFSSITVEHIASLNINVLYIPDDLPYDDCTDAIETALLDNHVTTVDIVVNHGYFDHLLPPNMPHKPSNMLTKSFMNRICHGFIINGHIHNRNVYGNILNGGSFERLNHGEEQPKGFNVIDYDVSKRSFSSNFIHNIYTTLFLTYDLTEFPDEQEFVKWTNRILEKCESTNEKIYLRIVGADPVIKQSLQTLAQARSDRFVIKLASAKRSLNVENIVMTSTVNLPIITPDNLSELLCGIINSRYSTTYSSDDIQKELLNACS